MRCLPQAAGRALALSAAASALLFGCRPPAQPPPAGQPGYVTFQLDAGMGLNVASQHKSEARLFLEWMTTPEFARLLGDELPGFFPMSKQAPALQDAHANTFLALSKSRDTDVRFVWEKLV